MRWVLLAAVGSCLGCFSGSFCLESEGCDTPAPSCEGQCVRFVGGAWAPVLASTSAGECPDVAPFAVMQSSAAIACGVQEADGACEEGFACVPSAPAWVACIARDGAHPCFEPYSVDVDVPEASLCCPEDEPPR